MRIRRVLIGLASLLGALVVLAGLAALATQTAPFRNWARGLAERQATRLLNGDVTIGRLDGNLFTGAQLTDVRVRQNGVEIIRIERTAARYSIRRLLNADFALTDVTLERPTILLRHDEHGWEIGRLLRRRTSNTRSTRTFAIDAITIEDGTVIVDDGQPVTAGTRLPERFIHLHTEAALMTGNGRLDLHVRRASFRTAAPDLDVQSLAGRLVNGNGQLRLEQFDILTGDSALRFDTTYARGAEPGRLRAAIVAKPLDVDEFAAYLPALAGRALTPTLALVADGPMDALALTVDVAEPRIGRLHANVIADVRTPRRTVRGSVRTERLELAHLLNRPRLASRLTGSVQVDLNLGNQTVSFDTLSGRAEVHSVDSSFAGYTYDGLDGVVRIAGRRFDVAVDVRAYGASARTTGSIAPGPDGVEYDLQGRAQNVDLRRLPAQLRVPRLDSRIGGDFISRGRGSQLEASLQFDSSTVEGATIGPDSQGHLSFTTGLPRYGFQGRVTSLDLARMGRALGIAALTHERYASALNGHVAVEGEGRGLDTLRLQATVALEPSTMLDATIGPAAMDASIEERRLATTVRGDFAALNPARLSGRANLDGSASGSLDVRATLSSLGEPLTPESVTAEGTVRLTESKVGSLAIETATLEARYADQGADITMLSMLGPSVRVAASGPLRLDQTGDSQLRYEISHIRLEELNALFGRDLSGRIQLEGTIAGNRARFTTKGTAMLESLRIDQTFEALEVETAFEASVDDLRPDTARVTAELESTLPTLLGRNFRTLTAGVDYAGSAMQFQVVLTEERRKVTGAGQLRLEPDAREVRVEQLAIDAGGVSWSTAQAGNFVVRFGGDGLVTLRDVALGSGTQRLSAEGTISTRPGVDGLLKVRFEEVDIGSLGTMALIDRMLGGSLNGTGEITGDPDTRQFTGQLAIVNGHVDRFLFQSLDASLRYEGGRIGIDAALVQGPGAQLHAKGTLVTAVEGPGADEPLNLDVTTTGIDLAVLEAVNPAFQEVTGLLLANVHVGGTAAAPRVDGSVRVEQGAFTFVPTGTRYSGATVAVALEGDQVRVERLQLLDDNGRPLDGSGSLSLQGRRVEGIDFTVRADQFKVLGNDLGELSVNTTLNIYGTLLAPRVAGLVRVHSGRLEVDALLDRFTSNAYATQPSQPVTPPAAAPPAESPERPLPSTPAAPVDRVPSDPEEAPVPEEAPAAAPAPTPDSPPATGPAFDITVEVPSNLVLRGSDIRPADSRVALGDLNVTLGGDFSIRKEPGADPVLVGTVRTVRGSYDFQGRRFEVLRDGTIAFRGQRPVDPALDVQAERVISGIVAHVNVQGTMRMPEVLLSSQPPLDEADILSLIIFNQPVNRLGEGQRTELGERAVGLASGFVVSPISDTLEHALDIDLFEIETVAEEGGGPSVTVGEQVGEQLFVKFRQTFGAQDASEFQLEYQLADFLRLQGSFAEGRGGANRSLTRRVERGGIDLIVFFSY